MYKSLYFPHHILLAYHQSNFGLISVVAKNIIPLENQLNM